MTDQRFNTSESTSRRAHSRFNSAIKVRPEGRSNLLETLSLSGRDYSELYESSPIKKETESEYIKKIHALNEYEKQFYPKFDHQEAKSKFEQREAPQPTTVTIDQTGMILTGK